MGDAIVHPGIPEKLRPAAGGQPFEPGTDPRRNRDGRPRSPRRLIRETLGGDESVVLRYLVGVFKDEGAPRADRIAAAGWLANAMRGSGIRLGRGALESWRDADERSRRDSDAALLRGLHGEPGANERRRKGLYDVR